MIDSKQAKQALATAKEQCKVKSCKQFCDEGCEWVKILDQFITATEDLITQNKNLKEQIEEYSGALYGQKAYPQTLHDSQAINPSVLESYDALLKENNELKEKLKKYEQENIN